ncbi:MAG TPA: hypothetical protein VGL21_06790 [Jatrophihabitantaceae bacterium]
MSRRKVIGRVLKVAGFLVFTAYVAVTVTTATGPAIDIAFDLAVYVALLVHLVRRWLRQQPPERRH